MPDNIIRNLLPQYQQAKRELEAIKINGLDHKHPTAISAVVRINTMKRQLNEGVVNLWATLKAKLDLATGNSSLVWHVRRGWFSRAGFSRTCAFGDPMSEITVLPAILALSLQPHAPMKTKDTKKETKKQPTKTPKEKKLAKQEKKNSR